MLNTSILLENTARETPDATAIVYADAEFSYAQTNRMANQVANGLIERGLQPNDKVALSCPNLPFFPVIYYGVLKTGAVVVPLNVLLKPDEIRFQLEDCDAKFYFCFAGTTDLPTGEYGFDAFQRVASCEQFFLINAGTPVAESLQNVTTFSELTAEQSADFDTHQTTPDDTAVILYTSGTTGRPKGAQLTHLNLLMSAKLSDKLYPPTVHRASLIALPLFHSYAQSVQMNAGFYHGGKLCLLPRFTPTAALELMQQHDVTFFCGVPTMFWALLNAAENLDQFDWKRIQHNLQLCASGGAPLAPEVTRAFEHRFDVRILEGYGITETSSVVSFNRLDRPAKTGSVGLPVWGAEIRVVDAGGNALPNGETGEIAVRGAIVMKGYYQKPEATAAAIRQNWFYTGDVGRFDAENYLYIVDRVKDVILRGGYNVYPREVEDVLAAHPAISQVAVIGVPDARLGEEVKAFVVLQNNFTLAETELIEWAKTRLAAHKYPRQIEFRDSLPLTATGKVSKRELR